MYNKRLVKKQVDAAATVRCCICSDFFYDHRAIVQNSETH